MEPQGCSARAALAGAKRPFFLYHNTGQGAVFSEIVLSVLFHVMTPAGQRAERRTCAAYFLRNLPYRRLLTWIDWCKGSRQCEHEKIILFLRIFAARRRFDVCPS
jgi:hypothetical protein